jgi:hypothetical protein
MGTFLHTRRFLSYHGNRFEDRSLLLEDERGRVRAVFPAAIAPDDPGLVSSHPGATYGGLVHLGDLKGLECREALDALRAHYGSNGLETLRYKPVPWIYRRRPCDDDLWAMFDLGATRYRCDLSCAIDIRARGHVSERRRRGARRAEKMGVAYEEDWRRIDEFWEVLTENLAARHDLQPVHSIEEINELQALFPAAISLHVALINNEVVGGVVCFAIPPVVHAQYIAASEDGRSASALDLVFERLIAGAHESGHAYFDFGISNIPETGELNDGLYRFKSEFGGGGMIHEHYHLDLAASGDPRRQGPS